MTIEDAGMFLALLARQPRRDTTASVARAIAWMLRHAETGLQLPNVITLHDDRTIMFVWRMPDGSERTKVFDGKE